MSVGAVILRVGSCELDELVRRSERSASGGGGAFRGTRYQTREGSLVVRGREARRAPHP
jgi:hypothetical protein